MTQSIVVLNGPAGVGKTTVSRHLIALNPGTVLIPGDVLREFAPADARAVLGPQSTYRAAAALIDAYLQMGAPQVVFEYVFEAPEQLDRFLRYIQADVPPHIFTLWAPLEVVVSREARRLDRRPLGPRVLTCYAVMQQHLDQLGVVLHTEARSAAEIAETIHRAIQAPPSVGVRTVGPA